MFHWTSDKERLRDGFNFYRIDDPASIGFKFKGGNRIYLVRWSKIAKRWFFEVIKIPIADSEFVL